MLEGAVVPWPVVGVDGSLLAASNGGVHRALDPATGADRWTYDDGGPYGVDLATGPTVLPHGSILWPDPGERLHALGPDGDAARFLQGGCPEALFQAPALMAAGARRGRVAPVPGQIVWTEPASTR